MIEALVWFGVFILLVNFIGIIPSYLIGMFTNDDIEDAILKWYTGLTIFASVILAYLAVNNMQFLASL